MSLINQRVTHKTFGEGNVVNYDDSYIKVDFESGAKKFVFPDAFAKYITLTDQRMAHLMNKKLQELKKERKKEALIRERQKAIEREKRYILEQKKRAKTRKIHPQLQSVFWCRPEEEDRVFTEWKVFIGNIKSGERKGQPRRLARMNQSSACLLTRREPHMPEEDRCIIGAFMAEEGFNGRLRMDGYIPAHPKYRIRLSERESEKMLFWNYYVNNRFPNNITWNSGRQRYFDNIWMAQILRDIVSLKEDPEEKKNAQLFLEYFCRINDINENKIPKAEGALTRS